MQVRSAACGLPIPVTSTNKTARRSRRIKCDEVKLACKRCIVGGYTCSGLVYGSSSFSASSTESPLKQWPIVRAPIAVTHLNGTADVRDLIVIGRLLASRFLYQSSSDPEDYLVGRMKRLSPYILHIPPRPGQSSTLDNAVACTAAALRTLYGTTDRVIRPK